jgi:hypothetical protein
LIDEPYHDAATISDMRAWNFGRTGTVHYGESTLHEIERINELALVSQIPERQLQPLAAEVSSRFSFAGGALEGERRVEFYRAGDGMVTLPVTIRVPYKDFTFLEKADQVESRIDVFGRILGPNGEVVDEFDRQETLTVPRDKIEGLSKEFLLYQLIFHSPPGEYQLEVAVRDNGSNTVRTASETLRVPDFSQPSLFLSSVVLADEIVKLDPPPPAGKKEPFRFGDFEAVPNFTRTFSSSGALNVYFEAYNLAVDEQGKNSLKLSYRFERDGARFREVPATYLYPTDQRQRSIMSAIPLKAFTPGEYTVVITLTDDVAGASATARESFLVK